jgi:hypothetical protein
MSKRIDEPKRESEPTELKLDDLKKVVGGTAPAKKPRAKR